MVDRDLQICDKNHNIKNLHFISFLLQPSTFLRHYNCPTDSLAPWQKVLIKGLKFTIVELEHLLEVIDELITIENPD
jgi:hypothetical protein